MKENPLVSVVIIFLNAEKFFEEAIESVLAQTYADWELLLVDDGSTDASIAIGQSYAQRYPHKIFYLEHANHQNRGMSASRNLGIRQSRGSYIAFLDADDVYLPHKLERQVRLLEAQSTAAMVYGPTQNWYSWTGQGSDLGRDQIRILGRDLQADRLYQPPELVVRFLESTARTPVPTSVLVRREAIERVGQFEERFTTMFEDQVFLYKLCLHEPVYVESEYLSRYRQHPESYVHVSRRNGTWDPGSRHPRNRIIFLNWLAEYLTEQKITNPLIWKSLRRELRPYHYPWLDRLLLSIHSLKSNLRMRLRQLL
jgi:glycosyltransferase involved in cell wall biosynthesis